MDETQIFRPIRSPGMSGATQRAAERLFGKSPGWKERFRAQCLEKVSELRHQAQVEHRQRTSGVQAHNTTNSSMSISETDNSTQSNYDTSAFEESEWMRHFIDHELSTFEQFDEDEEIDYHLTLEENAQLCSDLSAAFHSDAQIYGK